MDIFKDEINRIVYDQKIMLEDYTKEYKEVLESTDGHIIRCRNNGSEIYYRTHNENGKYVRKSISGDQNAINALARKEYLRVVTNALRKKH